MKSKIVAFPYGYFRRGKQLPLTPLMIDTLLAACAKQKEKIVYGPSDIRRSFISLVNRGLIIRKYVCSHVDPKILWQVSNEAILLLQNMGIESGLLVFAKTPDNSKIKNILIN